MLPISLADGFVVTYTFEERNFFFATLKTMSALH